MSKRLVFVYLALMGLLGLSVLFSFLPLGDFGSFGSLVISAIKAFLILFYFMKLNESSNSFRIIALGSIFWFLILLGLTASDYLTRS